MSSRTSEASVGIYDTSPIASHEREDKYKAKSFIETFVYRGGDQLAAWLYAGLAAIGLGLTGIAFTAIPISAIWLVLGVWLGRRQAVMAAGETKHESALSNLKVLPQV